VKELEQQLQSLEAQKRALLAAQQQRSNKVSVARATAQTPMSSIPSDAAGENGEEAEEAAPASPPPPPFSLFFRYPQYVWLHARPREDGIGAEEASRASGVADVEVSVVVDAHASVRVMAPRRPGQLLAMVAGLEALGLALLHLNVTTAGGALVLYTLSLKVRTSDTPDRFMSFFCIIISRYSIREMLTAYQVWVSVHVGYETGLVMSCAYPTRVHGLIGAHTHTMQHIAPIHVL
jgi:hypothetical protein